MNKRLVFGKLKDFNKSFKKGAPVVCIASTRHKAWQTVPAEDFLKRKELF